MLVGAQLGQLRKRAIICSLAAIVLTVSPAVAQEDARNPNEKAPIPKELEQLSGFVGDWTGKGTAGGEPIIFYTSCKWVLEGRFLELNQTFLNTRNDITSTRRQLVGWDSGKRRLAAWTFYSDGSYVLATGLARDGRITFEGCEITHDGKKKLHEGTVAFAGRDKWTYEVLIRNRGKKEPDLYRGEATRIQQLPDLPKEDGGAPRKELKPVEEEIRQWTNWTKTQPWRATCHWTLQHTILQLDTPLGKDRAQMLVGWNPKKSGPAYWWFDSAGNTVGPAVSWHMPAR